MRGNLIGHRGALLGHVTVGGGPASGQGLAARTAELRSRGGRFILAGVNPAMRRRLDRSGLTATLGAENIVMATDVVFEAADLAYEEGCRWLADDS